MSRLTFLCQMDLPHRAVAAYTYLYDRADKNDERWTSVKTIAGLIETEQHYREQGCKSNFLHKLK